MADASDAILRSLKTGDLVLFARPALARWLPSWLGRRAWSRVAMVVREGDHGEPMIWETAPGGTVGPRVRLRRLAKRLDTHQGRIGVRRLNRALEPAQCERLAAWRRELEARQSQRSLLDLMGAGEDGWLGGEAAALGTPLSGELVAESYQRIGLLDGPERGGMAAHLYTPRHFAEREGLALKHLYALGPEIPLVKADQGPAWEELTAQPA